MITEWEQLVGKTIEGTYHGHEGVVLLLGDEFAVIRAEYGYPNESEYPVLAASDNADALYAAVVAGVPEAQQLLDAVTHRRNVAREKHERRRLADLQEKYAPFPGDRELIHKVRELLSAGPLEGDVHSKLAEEIFGSDFTPDQRNRVKRTAFWVLYGGTPDGSD